VTVVDVGHEEDFDDGRMRIVAVGGKELGILRWAARWYAVRNVCPHLGAPVCRGPVQPLLRPGAGTDDLIADRDRPVLMCPWHRWEFDLDSGQAIAGKDTIRVYPVRVDGGRVYVEDGAAPEVDQPNAVRPGGGHSAASSPASHSA
jgi:nitrite reductase (NADH) small subunit